MKKKYNLYLNDNRHKTERSKLICLDEEQYVPKNFSIWHTGLREILITFSTIITSNNININAVNIRSLLNIIISFINDFHFYSKFFCTKILKLKFYLVFVYYNIIFSKGHFNNLYISFILADFEINKQKLFIAFIKMIYTYKIPKITSNLAIYFHIIRKIIFHTSPNKINIFLFRNTVLWNEIIPLYEYLLSRYCHFLKFLSKRIWLCDFFL